MALERGEQEPNKAAFITSALRDRSIVAEGIRACERERERERGRERERERERERPRERS
jgi:hypothetical protein